MGWSGCYQKIPFVIILILCNKLSHWLGAQGQDIWAFAISRIRVRQNNWIFLPQTEVTTSYRSISPELLGLLTGTSIQLAVNKGQEQQSLTPSSFSTASVQPWPMDVLWEKRVSSQRLKIVPGLMRVHLISLAKVNRKGMHLRYGNDILIVEGSGRPFACGALKGKEYRGKTAKLRTQSIWVGLQALAPTPWLRAIYLISMTLSFICRMRVMRIHTTSEG